MILSLAIILTYFGWTAAQFVAIGLVLNLLAGIPICVEHGDRSGTYGDLHLSWGMWSVSLNDTIQMGMILIGMIAVTLSSSISLGLGTLLMQRLRNSFNAGGI